MPEFHRYHIDFIDSKSRYVLLVAPSELLPVRLGTGLPYVVVY